MSDRKVLFSHNKVAKLLIGEYFMNREVIGVTNGALTTLVVLTGIITIIIILTFKF